LYKYAETALDPFQSVLLKLAAYVATGAQALGFTPISYSQLSMFRSKKLVALVIPGTGALAEAV
jgi:hypothetical protein